LLVEEAVAVLLVAVAVVLEDLEQVLSLLSMQVMFTILL